MKTTLSAILTRHLLIGACCLALAASVPGLSGDCPPFPNVDWSRTSVGLTSVSAASFSGASVAF
ncbi:MAG: hypothetical protein ACREEM_54240 [Blastocatellia bacterium]